MIPAELPNLPNNHQVPIYFSTGGARKIAATEFGEKLWAQGSRAVELSGGVYTSSPQDAVMNLKSKGCAILIHNYYPIPLEPFVLNLSSADGSILAKSMELARGAITLSSQVGAKYYGIHAGFLFDPKPEELGKRIAANTFTDRQKSFDIFLESMNELSAFANNLGIKLLVENNVLSSENMEAHAGNKLLLVDPYEIEYFLNICQNVGLLLDLGHLSVSSKSLGFDKFQALQQLDEYTVGYHVSDNNTLSDQHLELNTDSWFLGRLKKNVEFITLEIHSGSISEFNNSKALLLSTLADSYEV